MAWQAFTALYMILSIDTQEPAIAQQQAGKVDAALRCKRQFAEVDEHLLAGRGIEDIIIDPPVSRLINNRSGSSR